MGGSRHPPTLGTNEKEKDSHYIEVAPKLQSQQIIFQLLLFQIITNSEPMYPRPTILFLTVNDLLMTFLHK